MRNGLATDNFGGGKGIELIPFQATEVIIGIPAFEKRNIPATPTALPTGHSW